MKRRDLIKLLEKNGWTFLRNGGNHDIYTDGKSDRANFPSKGNQGSRCQGDHPAAKAEMTVCFI